MKTILIVDDEPNIREVLVSYLNKEHYLTLEAANGAEAFDFLRKQWILCHMDLMLPDMDGERYARRFERLARYPLSC